MGTTRAKSGAYKGLRLAIEAVERHGPLAPSQVGARIRLGSSFAFALPPTSLEAMHVTEKLFNLVLDFDPRQIDRPPIIETRYGDLPVGQVERDLLLQRLAARPDDDRALNLRRAAVELEEYAEWIHRKWDSLRRRVWEVLHQAEIDASEYLYRYLMANLAIIHRERDKYRRGGDQIMVDVWKVLHRVQQARLRWQVDELKRTATIVDGVALLLTLNAIVDSVKRNDLTIDAQARKEMAHAAGLQAEAHRQMMEGVVEYLTTLREEALRFPVLLVLDHTDVITVTGVRGRVFAALDAAEKAIGELCRTAVNAGTIPEYRVGSLTDMAGDIAAGSRVTVWKLPFFLDRAISDMPPKDGNIVRRMRQFAGEVERGNAIKHGIMLGGIDAAMLAAPLAGPVGVGVALMWAAMHLARSIHEYSQLTSLFKASIDRSVLLMGDAEHDPASTLNIVFDILGLWV